MHACPQHNKIRLVKMHKYATCPPLMNHLTNQTSQKWRCLLHHSGRASSLFLVHCLAWLLKCRDGITFTAKPKLEVSHLINHGRFSFCSPLTMTCFINPQSISLVHPNIQCTDPNLQDKSHQPTIHTIFPHPD